MTTIRHGWNKWDRGDCGRGQAGAGTEEKSECFAGEGMLAAITFVIAETNLLQGTLNATMNGQKVWHGILYMVKNVTVNFLQLIK